MLGALGGRRVKRWAMWWSPCGKSGAGRRVVLYCVMEGVVLGRWLFVALQTSLWGVGAQRGTQDAGLVSGLYITMMAWWHGDMMA